MVFSFGNWFCFTKHKNNIDEHCVCIVYLIYVSIVFGFLFITPPLPTYKYRVTKIFPVFRRFAVFHTATLCKRFRKFCSTTVIYRLKLKFITNRTIRLLCCVYIHTVYNSRLRQIPRRRPYFMSVLYNARYPHV